MKITRVVFWDPCISPHKADFIQALARLNKNIEVILCAHEDIPGDRKKMGWSLNSSAEYLQYIAPSENVIKALCQTRPEQTLHMFSGIRWVPTILVAIKAVRRSGAYFSIMMEPRVTEGFKGLMRIVQSRITENWFRKNASFILGIGRNGPAWFRLSGYDENLIHPFAYFINDNSTSALIRNNKEAINIAYIGRLVEMKGVADLIDAVSLLDFKYKLKIIGNGESKVKFYERASNNPLVQFLGVIPIEKISDFLKNIDILILPSRSMDDGWGVVVTEALLSGCVAIASECVGAAIVLEGNDINGNIVPAYAPEKIAEKICSQIQSNNLSLDCRIKRRNWALAHLTASAGAEYFMKIMRHHFDNGPRPDPFYQ